HHQPAHIEPPVGTDLSFLYEDENWIVVNKSAPLPAHPGGRFCRNTLTYLLDQIYHPQRTRLVHRLDASTTGVMILARHRKAAAELQRTIEGGGFEKTYLVRTQGQPEKEEFFCDVAISKDPVDGVRQPDPKGLTAETRFKVVRRLEDGSAILEAYPVTGRTNQIRLHAWVLGFPVMGDPIYKHEKRTRDATEPATVQETLGLHAWKLAFNHPKTAQRMEFVAPTPSWATL
ncbi:MAG: RluA family pseudouridine synthase, partial [Planctomycetota bacterium]|nr:RluA family pseudouridine synthase [Planctomycetota bacterium]